jgi:hypothetical protein
VNKQAKLCPLNLKPAEPMSVKSRVYCNSLEVRQFVIGASRIEMYFNNANINATAPSREPGQRSWCRYWLRAGRQRGRVSSHDRSMTLRRFLGLIRPPIQ